MIQKLLGFVFLLIMSCSAVAAVVSVSGVVILGGDRTKRTDGDKLLLFPDSPGKNVALTDDTSSNGGVYNLSVDGVQDTISSLWIVSADDSPYYSPPAHVTLGTPKSGIRISKMEDLSVVTAKPTVKLAQGDTARYIAALVDTESVKVKVGLRTRDAAIARTKDILGSTQRFFSLENSAEVMRLVKNEWSKSAVRQEDRLFTEESVMVIFNK